MNTYSRPIARRTFLRGLGTVVALPEPDAVTISLIQPSEAVGFAGPVAVFDSPDRGSRGYSAVLPHHFRPYSHEQPLLGSKIDQPV